MRVVKGDHLHQGNGLVQLFKVLGGLLDQTLALLQGLGILLLLLVKDLLDGDKALLPVGIVQPLDLHLHQFRQGKRQFQLFHQAQSAADDQPCQVARLDIGGDDAVAKHVGQAAGMVHHGIDALHGLDGLLQLLRRDADAARNFPAQIQHAVLVQIHHASKAGILGEDLGILSILQIVLDARQVGHLPDQIGKNSIVNGRRALGGPDKPLQTVAGVHDVVVHLLIRLVLDLDGPTGRGF